MKVQHSIVNNNKLNTVPVTNGQIIYVKDTHDLYFDVNNTRTKATDIIFVGTLQERDAIQSPTPNKVYCVEEDNKFYRYENNEWVLVGGEEVTPQVFYWDGTKSQASIDMFNTILDIIKTTPVMIVYPIEYTINSIKFLFQHTWYFKDTLPTSNTDTRALSECIKDTLDDRGCKTYTRAIYELLFEITNNRVTGIVGVGGSYSVEKYLSASQNISGSYTPQYNNSPANKKYVDDSLAAYTPPAADVEFDNTGTGIEATTVEDAIVELNNKIGDLNTLITEINGE